MEYIYSGVSLQNKRSSNMDSLILKTKYIDKMSALLAVVCDGVGSLSEGAFASAIAARTLSAWFDAIDSTQRIGLKMRDTILQINTEITIRAQEQNIQTASTLSALLFVENMYYIVHVGDSRIYCHDGGNLFSLTNDDVTEQGKLAAYIGQGESMALQYTEGAAEGKTFLICSDGLYKRMDNQELVTRIKADNMRVVKESVLALTEYVIGKGEQDNITIAVMKMKN